MITESTALPRVRKRRHPPGMEPNGSRGVDSVGARQSLQDDLPRAGNQSRAEQHQNVPPRAGMLGGVQQVGAGTAPHHVLHHFQQPGQRGRAMPVPVPVSSTASQNARRRDEQVWKVSCRSILATQPARQQNEKRHSPEYTERKIEDHRAADRARSLKECPGEERDHHRSER